MATFNEKDFAFCLNDWSWLLYHNFCITVEKLNEQIKRIEVFCHIIHKALQ